MANINYRSEKEFLAAYNIHDFEVPLVSVDMAIFTIIDQQLHVLLVKRAEYPSKGKWALPGGFVDLNNDKDLYDTAHRKLKEKTGVNTPYLEQVASFGGPNRDPRGWSITIAYFALISSEAITLESGANTEEVLWVPVKNIENNYSLAFDHQQILDSCHERMRNKVTYTSLPTHLLPSTFTLSELQRTFEIVLGKSIDKKSFRRRILDVDILKETGKMKASGTRPAMLYSVSSKARNYYFSRMI